MTARHKSILIFAALVWVVAIGVGFTFLLRYSVEPGAPAVAPQQWPRESVIPAPRNQYVLVMTMHPHCPCTRASVAELNNLMAMLRRDHVKGYVLAVKPAEFGDDWV